MSAKSVLIAWPIVNWNETLYEKPGFAAVQAGLGHFSDDRGHLPPIWLAGVSFRHVWHPDYDFYSPRLRICYQLRHGVGGAVATAAAVVLLKKPWPAPRAKTEKQEA
jgi:hypothetical protein